MLKEGFERPKIFSYQLGSILLSLALFVIGDAFLTSYVSLRLKVNGFSSHVIGIAHFSFYLGYFLAPILNMKLNLEFKKGYIIFGTLLPLGLMFQGFFIQWPFLVYLGRCIAGFSISYLYLYLESWLLQNSHINIRGQVFSFYMIANYLANSSSQMMLKFFDFTSLYPFIFGSVFCFTSIFPVIFLKNTCFVSKTFVELSVLNRIFFKSLIGVIATFFSGVLISSIYGFAPIFALDRDVSPAYFMFVFVFGGILFQYPIGYLSDFISKKTLLIILSFLLLIPLVFLAYVSYVYVLFCAFFIGGVSFVFYPLSATIIAEGIKQEEVVVCNLFRNLVYALGAMFGPLLASIFVAKFSYQNFNFYLTFVSCFFCIMSLFLKIIDGKGFYLSVNR